MKIIFLLATLCLASGLIAPRSLFAESGLVFDQTQGTLTGQLNVTSGLTASSATFINAAGAGLMVSSSAYLAVAGGKVGIGTTGPGKLVEISKGVLASDTIEKSTILRLLNPDTDGVLATPNRVGIGFGASTTRQAIVGGTNGNDFLDFYTNGNLTAPKVKIDAAGNVGIGTTSPPARLSVFDNSVGGSVVSYIRQDDNNAYGLVIGNLTWSDTVTNGLRLYVNATTHAAIDAYQTGVIPLSLNPSGGKVGIGTTGPNAQLDVAGANAYGFAIKDTGGTNNVFQVSRGATAGSLQIIDGGTTKINIVGDANGNSWFNTGGNLGIGTAGPNALLEITKNTGAGLIIGTADQAGSSASPLETYIKFEGYDNEMRAAIIAQDKTTNLAGGWLRFQTANTSNVLTDRLMIDRDGNVGMGTTSPESELDIRETGGDDDVTLALKNADSAVYALSLTQRYNAGNMFTIKSTGYNIMQHTRDGAINTLDIGETSGVLSQEMRFFVDSGEGMRIDQNGKVGIGTTNPAAALDVGGTGAIKIPVGTTGERPASPANGMVRLNTTTGKLEYYNGAWYSIGAVVATGGTVTEIGGYRIHTFTTSGTFTVINGGSVDYLVVGGGGSGGGGWQGGGGGAGGLLTGSLTITAGAKTVTVGAGGTGGGTPSASSGGNSTFDSITATGGGYGAGEPMGGGQNPANGGSGGGGSHGALSGPAFVGTGIAGQGNNGGQGISDGTAPGYYIGGGGGGAGAAGQNALYAKGGDGGAGIANSISGSSVYYAGGGGGSRRGGTAGAGGTGGGGNGGTTGANGTANTGGGGGAGNGSNGTGVSGSGGSGIVIIRYPI
ncbi:MAG: hypothetical protein NTY45_10030 [Elusimicrobia bacterium]|nr:hypothetical protein [Elusimicrobiota bacterium]